MKNLSNYKKILRYLFIPGFILTVAGLVAALTTQTWSTLYLTLVIVGGICLFIWLLFLLITGRSFWQKRSTQTGTNALVATLSLLAILTIINFIAVRYSPRIDLTENQLYTLSLQSQEIVKKLENPVKVYIFDKDINPQDKDLLKNYQRYNDNFQFELVDPDLKVGLTEKFNVQSLGDVYLEYEDKKQLVQTLITFNQRELLSEIKLTNAIAKIQKNYLPKIYILQGHGEYSLEPSSEGSISEAVNSLKSKGYEVNPLNLVENSGIPEEADVILLISPKRQLFEQEVTALKQYSGKGGNILLLLDPNSDAGLEPILKDWGIKLDNRIIIDGSGAGNIVGLGPTTPFITTYGNHPITEDFGNSISFYPLSRPVDTVEVENVEATSLLVTSEQMWAESDLDSEEVTFNQEEDIAGPFDLGVALSRKIAPETNNSETRENTQQNESDKGNSVPETENKQTEDNSAPNSLENEAETESNEPKKENNINDDATQESKDKLENEEQEKTENIDSNSPEENTTTNSQDDNENESIETEQANEKEQENTVDGESANSSSNDQQEDNKQEKSQESRLVIIGNSTFATNNLFNQQLNGDVFLNSVQWLSNQDEQTLSIRPKEAKNRRLNISPSQVNLITILSLGVVPLLGLIAAGITWWRRR
ncbi:MAG: Gldg family protein [Crocosphaera sp.]|nr:Gldg family protein [Crocosphaera sp.]